MPGLSQLKQFNKDMAAIGDETSLRASRGEHPVRVPIPKTIKDVNDSNDFILGMPENELEDDVTPVDNDLSDIINSDADNNSDSKNAEANDRELDLSSLLNPMGEAGDNSSSGDMPDLSDFMDEPETNSEPEAEESEAEPEPVSIADMGLEDLLSGTGFDGSDINEIQDTGYSTKVNSDEFYTDEELENVAPPKKISKNDKHIGNHSLNDSEGFPGLNKKTASDSAVYSDKKPSVSAEEQNILSELADIPGLDLSDLGVQNTNEASETDDSLNENSNTDISFGSEDQGPEKLDNFEDIPDLENVSDLEEAIPDLEENLDDLGPDLSLENNTSDSIREPEISEAAENFAEPEVSDSFDSTMALNPEGSENSSSDFNLDDFNLDDLNFGDENNSSDSENQEEESSDSEDLFQESAEETGKNISETSDLEADAGKTPASSTFDFGRIDINDFPDSDPTHVAEPLNDFDYPDENQVFEEPLIQEPSKEIDDILDNVEDVTAPASNSDDSDRNGGEVSDIDDILNNIGDEEKQKSESEFDDLNLDDIEDIGFDSDSIKNEEKIPDKEASDFDVMDAEEVPLEAVENEGNDTKADIDVFDTLEDISSEDDSKVNNNSNGLESLDKLEDIGGLEDIGDFDSSDGLESIDGMDGLEEVPEAENDSKNELPSENIDSLENLDDLTSDSSISENTDSEGLEDLSFDDLLGNTSDAASSENSDVTDEADENAGPSMEDLFGSGLDDLDKPDFQETIPDSNDKNSTDDIFAAGIDDEAGNPVETPAESESSEDLFADFDASELEGLDFSTGNNSDSTDNQSFDLGDSDDFAMEGSDFEIAGYTDVDIAKEEKKAPVLPTPDFTGALEGSKLPPNTLSDEQYRQFSENLQTYPLNVRLAFEDLIVKDEFTDDAEFEIIEKIINKVPARQLAATLEKMLDISLPVPRDFEHRTAGEYEAYKKSLQYQLRNKIIPGALIAILCFLVGLGIFQFIKNCIYKPAKANSLYKQGYALLEADEYPQSEIKFNEAVEYKINKNWFFNYARGYRAHKQYQRAEDMYDKILQNFKHDKEAGLEYANMELKDIGNYPKAEEIVRRQVLDWHINDPDGILTLGDAFLEWATEKDPSKFESAREQYATLINLYGAKPLYLSRMMRYFVRTDNLQQVLQLKASFDNNKKYKYDADDITELSGYLLDKLYGPVSPAEEYLKNMIEGVRGLLLSAVSANPDNPTAWYNLSRYYINTRETTSIESALQRTIQEFNEADTLRSRDIYNYIDSYRLLGEYYVDREDYLKAQEQYTEGLSLYTTERDNAGFAGTEKIGQLYSDLADINYFVSSEYKQALSNYEHAVDLNFDNPQIRYRIGYIQYRNQNYAEALSSFMKASEGNIRHKNLMLAMANTLSLRGDDYAASGYYESLISILDDEIKDEGIVFPQANAKHYDLIDNYLYASNNYGVTLHRLAVRTGDSALNADAIVQFQQSVRAWDALTRNQDTMVRLDGSNLALENIRYITHPFSDYEPAIYTEIRKVLTDAEGIN